MQRRDLSHPDIVGTHRMCPFFCHKKSFLLGVPLRVGLSAISLLAFCFSPRSKNPVVCCPLSVVLKCSQRMPLQSLTQRATSHEPRALGKTAHSSWLTAHSKKFLVLNTSPFLRRLHKRRRRLMTVAFFSSAVG